MQILENWNQLQTIPLSQDALDIKNKVTQKSSQNTSSLSSGGKDLTADDIFKIQEKIRQE